jgi:hypothetical protein
MQGGRAWTRTLHHESAMAQTLIATSAAAGSLEASRPMPMTGGTTFVEIGAKFNAVLPQVDIDQSKN